MYICTYIHIHINIYVFFYSNIGTASRDGEIAHPQRKRHRHRLCARTRETSALAPGRGDSVADAARGVPAAAPGGLCVWHSVLCVALCCSVLQYVAALARGEEAALQMQRAEYPRLRQVGSVCEMQCVEVCVVRVFRCVAVLARGGGDCVAGAARGDLKALPGVAVCVLQEQGDAVCCTVVQRKEFFSAAPGGQCVCGIF